MTWVVVSSDTTSQHLSLHSFSTILEGQQGREAAEPMASPIQLGKLSSEQVHCLP